MAHPYHHALSSVRKWGGRVEDYLPVHHWFDASKAFLAGTDRLLSDCPECAHSLTQDGGVGLLLSVGSLVVEAASRLDSAGRLVDTADGCVAAGFHSATLCGGCGVLLLDVAEEDQER